LLLRLARSCIQSIFKSFFIFHLFSLFSNNYDIRAIMISDIRAFRVAV
jgi:hypothetical protein